MNREQRRKLNKAKSKGTVPKNKARRISTLQDIPRVHIPMPRVNTPKQEQQEKVADFSNVPLATMCQSIQLLINELYSRGIPIYDFDNKNKFVQQIQIIQGKVYFLAAEENTDHEKV